MTESVIVGIIAAVASIAAAIITSRATQSKVQQQLKVSDEVQNVKIESLTHEVRKHNGFAERIPVIEERVAVLNREMKEVKQKAGL